MNIKYIFSKFIKKVYIPAVRDSKLDKTSKVCSGSHIVNSSIGRYSYIGNYSTVINARIGSFCSIADNCIIGGASHPINWVSTSPVFYKGKNILKKNFSNHEYQSTKITNIGSDVWIGNNSLIKSGVRIGDGAVIGMGAIVTKDVGEFEIWAGNPARLLRKRHTDECIEKLNTIKWWEWDDQTLEIRAKNFNDIEKFIGENRR